MPHHTYICRPTSADFTQLQETRDMLQQSREALKEPMPDTFLGRTTHQPTQVHEASSGAEHDVSGHGFRSDAG